MGKLGLGTVQFGMNYGIANRVGQTPSSEVKSILEFAKNHGITVLDTAAQYGNSEDVLGENELRSFSVVTKTLTSPNIEEVEKRFHDSLKRLRLENIYGLLIHNSHDLISRPELARLLTKLKGQGFVRKIGVSVYTGDQIDRVEGIMPIDLIQVPMNLFDQRLIKSGHLRRLFKKNIEIHVRSVFLQGLFFLGQDEVAKKFPILVPHFERVQKVVQNYGMSMIEAALGFVLSQKEVDVALVGVTTIDELKTIVSTVESLKNKDFSGSVASVVDTCFLQDETILNPSQWVNRG